MADPYLPFFVSDWISDDDLDGLDNIGAVGLWIEMLTRMQKAGGRFVLGGKPVTMDNGAALIAKHVRCIKNVKEAAALLDELHAQNIFSIDSDGVIYSRRIVRDAERRQQGRENGKRGGNPKLTGRDNSPTDNPPGDKAPVNPQGLTPTVNPPGENPKLVQSSPVQINTPPQQARAHAEQAETVDLSDLDDDPAPDQRHRRVPEVSPIGGVSFARWFVEVGVAEGVIDEHVLVPPSSALDYGRRFGGIEAANSLLAAYGETECKVRAHRLFAAVKAGTNKRNPSIETLSRCWSKPDIAGEFAQPKSASDSMIERLRAAEQKQRALRSVSA